MSIRGALGFGLCALLMLLAACGTSPSDASGDAKRAQAPSIGIVTLNLWHDQGDWPRRQALIVDTLRELQPDVIVLQEVLQDDGLPNQAGELARQLGYAWHFVSVDPSGRARRYGNAILTRQSPLARGERALQPFDDYRIAGWVRVEVGGRAINVYVAHLNFTDATGATRTRQVADLLDFVATTRGDAPVVIAGDFNTGGDAGELAPLRAGFVDAYAALHANADSNGAEHVTLNPHYHPAPRRIDLVFAQRGAFQPWQARRILDQPAADGSWGSDHFGVWTQLLLQPGGRIVDRP